VDGAGTVETRLEVQSIDDPDEFMVAVAALVDELGPREAAGVGVGAAGIVDIRTGHYLYGPNTGLRDIDMAGRITKQVGLPAVVDNDANCATWGEHRFGAGRGTRHFLCVTLGTGIGGGLVLNGEPYRGAHGGAAEIGHMLVDPAGPLCGCGRVGCWEQFASGLALERMAREELVLRRESALYDAVAGDPSRVIGPMITEAARGGDAFARSVVDRVARWIGWGLASLWNIFEPERIAIGGGLASDWDLFEVVARDAMRERGEAPEYRSMPDLMAAELGPDAGIVGAALLVLEPGR
jgi:glucokinase